MPWQPLPRIAFAVATYPFAATSDADLPLEIGDELYIIEQGGEDGSWYRGYLVAPPSLLAGLTSVRGQTLEARVFSGIFPKSCVEVREVLGDTGVDGHTHPAQINGDSSRPDQANGGSPQHVSSVPPKSSLRRSMSGSSTGYNGLATDADGSRINGVAKRPLRTTSQAAPNQAGNQGLSRAYSISQPRSSSLPFPPTSDNAQKPSFKRPQAPVPMLKIGDETPTSSSEPLVDEIASCLREWHSKNLHELLLTRRYPTLEKVSDLVNRLDVARRQLLHGVLTAQELSALREETIWNLVDGNKMLSNEVIVRCPRQRGRILTADDSAVEMTNLQSHMSLLDRPPIFQPDPVNLYHLLVDVKSFANNGLISPTMTMYLCSRTAGAPPRVLTESFVVDMPPQEDFEKMASAGRYRTLFIDLTSNDVGDAGGQGRELYLVVKIQANQMIRTPSQSTPRKAVQTNESTSPGKSASGTASNAPSIKGGRQSLLWAQKRFGSVRSVSQPDPGSPRSPGSTAGSSSSTHNGPEPQSPETSRPTSEQGIRYVKKNVGVGVLNIKHQFGNGLVGDQQISQGASTVTTVDIRNSMDDWDELIQNPVKSRNRSYAKSTSLDHINLGLQSFASPDAADLIMKTPTVLQNVAPTQRTNFPGAPTKPRSDIYLKLSKAFLPRQVLLSHPERGTVQLPSSLGLKNVQLTLEVRKNSGERIERCIFPGSSSSGLTAWRTSAVERGESWNEMIRLAIPTKDVPEAHIIMSIADAPGFPFALAWMPLWREDAFVKDGTHAPLLYIYDKVTSSSNAGKGAYLSFPWDSKSRDGDTKDDTPTGSTATLALETELCSTFFSQDTTLLGILKWVEQPRDELLELLRRFAFVPEIEIVKLVGDVFEALFGILVEHAGQDVYEDAVFDALVTLLGKLNDRRFNMGAFVNAYADVKFDYPYATPCLIRGYLRLFANPSDPGESRRLRATIKVGRQIFRFIVRARALQEATETGDATKTQMHFKRYLRSVFDAFEALMKSRSPILIGSKTLAAQHMHTWLPELKPVFSEEEILEIATGFLNSCTNVQGKLILYRLVCILNLADPALFSDPSVRQALTSYTIEWIDPYWGFEDGSKQWAEQVRLCCSIASRQVTEFQLDDPALYTKAIQSYRSLQTFSPQPKDHISLLFPSAYPFPSKAIPKPAVFDEALTELAALLAALAGKQMSRQARGSEVERADLLFDSLDVIMSILSGSAFPKSWLSLYVFHHKSSLQILESLFGIIVSDFIPSPEDADTFNTELWSKYLLTLLTLVRSDTLALETFPEQKRRAVWKIAGDVREQGANLLKRSWEAIGWESSPEEYKRYGLSRLGGFQVQYVPTMVAPIVEVCLSVHEGLRNVAVRILQAMIVSEWTLNEDLSVIQAEMIDCFVTLFQTKAIGESFVQKMFVNELLDLFGSLAKVPQDPMWQAIKDMITTVDELLELLAAAHSPDITEALRIMNTLQLMNFLKHMQKEDIFIRYVHHLAQVQAKSDHKTEAGLALRLHADLYTWEETTVRPLTDPDYPEQTSFERKEQLYFAMIKSFEEGEAWASALSSYRELAEQYENVHYDFSKLARTHRSMATIYESIAKGDWQSPRYFRVIYQGMGFPSNLRGKQFIYEGQAGERQSMFTDRMRRLHPTAQIVPKGETEDIEGQYLQIFPVSPYRDLELRIYQQPKVNQSIRDFITTSKPRTFAVTSKRHSPSSGVHNQWVEKTLFSTRESFPTILRRSEIVGVEVVRLSPLQTAVERITRKTSELASLEKQVSDGDEPSYQSLTDAILSSVDPAAVASVAQYRHLLSAQRELAENEENDETPPHLEDALQIALLDHVSTLKHCLTNYTRPDHAHTRAFLSDNLQETFAPEIDTLAPNPVAGIVNEYGSMPDQSFSGVPSYPTPALTSSHGDTSTSTADPLDRPKPVSRLSLNFLKSPTSSIPKTNGSASAPSAISDEEPTFANYNPAVRHSLEMTRPSFEMRRPSNFMSNNNDTPTDTPGSTPSGKPRGPQQRLSSFGSMGGANNRPTAQGMGGVAEE